jgi:hypothetical protein
MSLEESIQAEALPWKVKSVFLSFSSQCRSQ